MAVSPNPAAVPDGKSDIFVALVGRNPQLLMAARDMISTACVECATLSASLAPLSRGVLSLLSLFRALLSKGTERASLLQGT